MVRVVTSSRLETALRQDGGSVTAFLEHLVGEPIDALVRVQETSRAAASNVLHVVEGHVVLLRAAVLHGRMSGRPYVYAESELVPSRLSQTFHERVTSTCEPIGRILREEGITPTRQQLATPDTNGQRAPSDISAALDDCVLCRRYRIDVDGTPVMAISEWFLASLRRFFVE